MATSPVYTLEFDYALGGYHAYKDKWEPLIGEMPNCRRERTNPYDLYAVAVIHHREGIVGHLPKTKVNRPNPDQIGLDSRLLFTLRKKSNL